jgi:hypothetical protein
VHDFLPHVWQDTWAYLNRKGCIQISRYRKVMVSALPIVHIISNRLIPMSLGAHNLLMWWPLDDDTDWSSVYSNVRSGGGSGRWPKLWCVQDACTMVNWFSQWQEFLARLANMSHSCAPFPPLSTSMWHCTWSVCSKSSKPASLGKILSLNLQKIDT